MDKNIIDTLIKIEFFDNKLSYENISKLAENAYITKATDKSYLIKLSRKNNVMDGQSIADGNLDDIDMCYEIYEYKNYMTLKEYLEKSNNDATYNIAYKFGRKLKGFHQIKPRKDVDWYNLFNTKANYLFYMHGLSDKIGDSDYILIDYISHNIHLTKSVKNSYIYINLTLDNILVSDNNEFVFLNFEYEDIGDPVFDFTKINKIAIDYPKFAKGVLNGYFNDEKPPTKFFRLLAVYQAYLILKNIVMTRDELRYKYSKEEENALLLMYDNFNQEVPIWV